MSLHSNSLASRPALFGAFPELEPFIPWTPLLTGPTPVDRWTAASPGQAEILVKRDDLADDHYGGNKARKLEFILGQLMSTGHTALWTCGEMCSNHCTAAAIYGRLAGLKVRLFLMPSAVDQEELELLRLQAFSGAEQVLLPGAPRDWMGFLAGLMASSNGPYLVPPGGSSTAGVLGFVSAGLELSLQVREGSTPCPDVIYIAAASYGTVMGLAMGLRLGGLSPRIVAVETVTRLWQHARLLLPTPWFAYHRLCQLSDRICRALPPFHTLRPERCRLFERLPTQDSTPSVAMARLRGRDDFGLELDPHFSGRAFAAMLHDLDSGRLHGKTVLFWQTHGRVNPSLLQSSRECSVQLPLAVAHASAQGLRSWVC